MGLQGVLERAGCGKGVLSVELRGPEDGRSPRFAGERERRLSGTRRPWRCPTCVPIRP